ncbi:MAG TPA: sigma-54 dependent transcriptional regulator [Myxococcota bacterium]|nr:sigma-54 dependent transcriptional regulator [Myxococcota bacterium]HOH77108.1 sigma-54 dependent transcriptional regulator [Myxococcota bacterium]
MMARILVVEDDQSLREVLRMFLNKSGHDVTVCGEGDKALKLVASEDEFDLVLTDLRLGAVTGLEILTFVKEHSPQTEVIMMTAFSTVETAIDAMRRGAFDYIGKPFKLEEISITLQKALERRNLSLENIRLRIALSDKYSFAHIVGKSQTMHKVFEKIIKVAPTKTSVLITGESGTGKELVARAVHFNSNRKDKPFVVVNCGAIPDQLMESELFGHVKGAFTGAHATRHGLFESADGGTIFLDEIGELSLAMQVKLLRFLQDHKIRMVGGVQEISVDTRVVAATNRDLSQLVQAGAFREDLFYRLNVIGLHLPPLRERREDIPVLVMHFIEKYRKELGRDDIRGVSPEVMDILSAHEFKGNVRELENIVEHAMTFASDDRITPDALPEGLRTSSRSDRSQQDSIFRVPEDGMDLEALLADIERRLLLDALSRCGGVRKNAADLLGISFRSIRYKLAKYGLGDEE